MCKYFNVFMVKYFPIFIYLYISMFKYKYICRRFSEQYFDTFSMFWVKRKLRFVANS